jgi:high affinity Mn2+ porin
MMGWVKLMGMALSLGCLVPQALAQSSADAPTANTSWLDLPGDVWSVHTQFTYLNQWHPSFKAPYSGDNSLNPSSERKSTSDITWYLGRKLWQGGEFYLNPELDQGFGLSNTLGAAGYTSGEAYKVGNNKPYMRYPRAFLRQSVDLGGDTLQLSNDYNQVDKTITSNNLVWTVGKFSVVDIFDTNTYAHDPRADFMNWTLLDSGAFDYAADSWGFSSGAALEWTQNWWTLRAGLFTLSKTPNSELLDLTGKQFEWVQEFEARHTLAGQAGKIKLLGFMNKGYMGQYSDAVSAYNAKQIDAVDTGLVRKYNTRTGYALNAEQDINVDLGAFFRFSHNDGGKETYDFTDVNESLAAGFSLKGDFWGRVQDTLGLGWVNNKLSQDAINYFKSGGLGVLIGDGQLNYKDENITEIFYNCNIVKSVFMTLDYQRVQNPAYNKDRGPVNVLGFRLHLDLL